MGRDVVLVTGASSGIGLELARLFAKSRHDLVLVARDEARLQALAEELRGRHDIDVRVLVCDLAADDATREIFDELQAAGIHVDVLVNNAGFGIRGTVATLDLQAQLDMIQVNVTALTSLTRLFLSEMVARRRGAILNVASTAGFQPGPHMAVYYATKAYVLSFTEGLAEELRGQGVRVTCLAPGPTETRFGESSGADHSRLFRLGTMAASDVAQAGYDGLRRGQVLVVPGLVNKIGTLAVRVTPRGAVRKILKSLQST